MDEAEYQWRHEDLKFEILIYNGLISGLWCFKIAITVGLLLSVGNGFSWVIGLSLYICLSAILIILIRNCGRSIKRLKQALEDLIEPFG